MGKILVTKELKKELDLFLVKYKQPADIKLQDIVASDQFPLIGNLNVQTLYEILEKGYTEFFDIPEEKIKALDQLLEQKMNNLKGRYQIDIYGNSMSQAVLSYDEILNALGINYSFVEKYYESRNEK